MAVKFPKRPDLTVLSETIPLFYIGQNRHGFWMAREAEGRCGGVFLLRRSAVRFARKQSAPAGCAMMFLNERFELDLENRGSRLVEPIAAAMDMAARRAPAVAAFVAMAVDEWRKLVAQISRAVARRTQKSRGDRARAVPRPRQAVVEKRPADCRADNLAPFPSVTVVALVDLRIGLAGADVENFFDRRLGAIPPAAAERLK